MTIELLPFQEEDVAKASHENNILICSEMGTGKTLVTVTLNRLRIVQSQPIINERWQTLVVAPLATHQDAWAKWFRELDPKLNVLCVDPKNRDKLKNALEQKVEDCQTHGKHSALLTWERAQESLQTVTLTGNTTLWDCVEAATRQTYANEILTSPLIKLRILGSGTLQQVKNNPLLQAGATTLEASTISHLKNMMNCLNFRTDTVLYVQAQVQRPAQGHHDSQLTIAIVPDESEGYFVSDVTPLFSEKNKNPAGLSELNCTCPPSVIIVHWEGLRLMPWLKATPWLHIIADECHRMQNRQAQQTTAIKRLSTVFKTALSGTPVTTNPQNFWSVLNWLYPKEFSSYWKFYGKFVDFEIKYIDGGARKFREVQGPKNVDVLHEKIGNFYIRHMKKKECCVHHPQGVQPELPDKYFDEITVELGPKQRKLYNDMKKDMLAWVGEFDDKPIAAPMAIAKLVRLQQFAGAYADVDSAGNVKLIDPSAKLDALMERLKDTDGKIVVFSQFKQMINLLEARLKKKDYQFVKLTGDTPQAVRGSLISKFQEGDAQVFAGTIGAGGVGITLTASSQMHFLDRSWSPALNWQAEDRCHRIGQPNAVQVIDYIAKGTVDLGKQQRLEVRSEWLRKLLGDS